MTSNLNQFNTTLKEFLTNLINIFPQTQNDILNHYRPLLENGEYEPLEYCKEFMHRAQEYHKDIANKNESIFHHSICLFPGIDFELIWNSSFNTPKSKKTIWIYLNVFWSLGTRAMQEEKKHQEKIAGLSDDDKILLNLQEATHEQSKQNVSSKELFIKNLTDRELLNELERRKTEKSEQDAMDADEEDLLNFDPNQGYSIWNALKGITGGNNMFSGISDFLKSISDMFGIDLTNFNIENFDMGDIGNMMKNAITPENMNKLRDTLFRFASEFQEDIDSGDIDRSELNNIFTMVKENIVKMANGEFETPEQQEKLIEQLLDSSSKAFGKSIPPHMKNKFKKMQRDLMKDPSKIRQMMSNPSSLMEEMQEFMGDDKGMQNRFNNATRHERERSRLAKVHEQRQKAKMEQEPPVEDVNIAKKKKNRKKKKKVKTNTNDDSLVLDDIDIDDIPELE